MVQNNQSYFSDLRQRILNDALLWISITATPSVIISLSRVYILKLSPWIALVQILLFSALWLTYFFRKKLAYHARVFSILIILWVGMTFGLLSLGPVANAGVYAILTAFIAILFLSGKGAAWIIAINTISLILIGIAASKQWISFSVDYPVYAHNPMVWVLLTWSLAAHAIIFALIGWRMIQGLLDSESKFHTLYDSTSDAVMLLDDKGVFDCNNAAMKMFGCTSKAQLMASSIYELSPTSQPDGSNSIERTLPIRLLAND